MAATGNNQYDADKALKFANSHYNTNTEWLCAQFVSECLKAGGIAPYSASSTALRTQLINSELGDGYSVKL